MFRSLLQEEGPFGLTKGLSARIIAMVPSSVAMVLGYETVKRLSLKSSDVDIQVQEEGYLEASFWNVSCTEFTWRDVRLFRIRIITIVISCKYQLAVLPILLSSWGNTVEWNLYYQSPTPLMTYSATMKTIRLQGIQMTEEKQGPRLGVCFKIYVHLVIRCQLKELPVFYHTFLYIISLRF